MTIRVVGLFRVSTDMQANHGASLDAQVRRFDELAALNRWHVCAKHRGCESATKAGSEREVLQAALRSIREHDASAIYVHEQSRLTRGDELDVAILTRELRERGCKVIVNGLVRDLESIDERFAIRIQSVVDRTESERLAERCKRGKRERALQGRWFTGNAPYGYSNPPANDARHGTLQLVPDEAAIVRAVFNAFAFGESARCIASRMSIPRSSLLRMLRNPAYIGTLAAHRWKRVGNRIVSQPATIEVKAAHEPIIDDSTWQRVQGRLGAGPRRGIEPAMLTNILHVNGMEMKAQTHRGQKFYIAPSCWLSRRMVDGAVWDGFCRILQTPTWIDRVREALSDSTQATDSQREADQHRLQIAKLQKRLDRLVTMRADGEIGKGEYDRSVSDARARMDSARSALAACDVQPLDAANELQRVARAVGEIVGGAVPTVHRRRLIEGLFGRVDATVTRKAACRPWALDSVAFCPRGMATTYSDCAHNPVIVRVVTMAGGVPTLRVVRGTIFPTPAKWSAAGGAA